MDRDELRRELALTLRVIYRADLDKDYATRYSNVLYAVGLAAALNYPAGFDVDLRTDPPGFPIVAYIELPKDETTDGPWEWQQISWHMRVHIRNWNGHTTPEKYRIIEGYIARYADPK